jgi:aquaporin Z
MHPTCLFPWYPPAQKRLLLGNQAKFAAPREVAPLDEMVFNVRCMERSPSQQKLNWSEYACEMAGSAFNIFVGLSAVVFDFGRGLWMERWIPDGSVRLLLTGLIYAGSGSLFAVSPLGRLSGAHINPSVSLAFWACGKMHLHDLGGYIVGQIAGSILGAVLLTTVWGKYAASVNDGMTLPGAGYPLWFVFSAELGMTCLLVVAIFVFVSSHRLMSWTPFMTWLLVAGMVWLGAPISGTSLNPARSFGPALVRWFWQNQWLYWIAPSLGALLAVGLFHLIAAERKVLTAKLFHVADYTCIFKRIHVPHLRPNHGE